MQAFITYLQAILKADKYDITEHSLRSDLQQLIQVIITDTNSKITLLHEPKRLVDYGAPDFKLTISDAILGYVENKAIGVDLDNILKTDQITRYKKLSNNILLTNYLDWIWIKDGKIQARKTLCYVTDLSVHRFKPDEKNIKEVQELIKQFLSSAPEGIGLPKKLAEALGQRGKLLKDYLLDELKRQQNDEAEGRLFGLYNTFVKLVDHELKLEDFTDTFAQMLVYGLFMARLNSDTDKIDLKNVDDYIPSSFELIGELVGFLKELNKPNYSETRWIVEEVLAVLNTMDLIGITQALSFDKKNKQATAETAKDPYVYFYEDFLAAYDKALKKAKGVYYTPPPVVNFIVRAVNDVLKDTFGIADGLADYKKVTVLDFACGTGTFLLEIIRQILDAVPVSKQDLIIKEHILKNIYGFEYMIAPYTVAHLKLTQYLKEKGYELDDDERFKVFLTNTLEHFEGGNENLLPALSKESKSASGVKDKPILVITGNPPYSYVSHNNGEWIKGLVKDYYFCDGKPLGVRNPKGLQDDYVKFIRFAQWKIDQVDEGMVAIITNHSYLDSPTFRGMRQSLMKTFNQMYFLDLHGNSKKKETAPDGGKDENVFDIMQGVCISILLKINKAGTALANYDISGTRLKKYELLNQLRVKDIEWSSIESCAPFYCYNLKTKENILEYYKYVSIKDCTIVSNTGIKTHRDHFAIGFQKEEIIRRVNDFSDISQSDHSITKLYSLPDTRDWKLNIARKLIYAKEDKYLPIKRIAYRPFDVRFTYYDPAFIELTKSDVFQHFELDNISLVCTRQIALNDYSHIFVTDIISETCFISNKTKETSYIFPLFLYSTGKFLQEDKVFMQSNFKPEIIQMLKSKYSVADITPEAIMGYIYAVLYSPTYRSKYKDFLKTDFPRIPFTDDYAIFQIMAVKGNELIQAHLQRRTDLKTKYPAMGDFTTKGDNVVVKVVYDDTHEKLYINPTQYFANVPERVWSFYIGGYQVLQKYLKDRKGRTLTLDEINNVEDVAKILAYTIDTMIEIDELSQAWI
ncbi:MAG: N-6 DNA methylase [Candidatus Cloacimonetes bacterium]|nr:N-6 DNA methylase [Candidatus Cloacimonadota bacterium]